MQIILVFQVFICKRTGWFDSQIRMPFFNFPVINDKRRERADGDVFIPGLKVYFCDRSIRSGLVLSSQSDDGIYPKKKARIGPFFFGNPRREQAFACRSQSPYLG